MQASRRSLPLPVVSLLARLPKLPGSWLFANGLNLALASQLPADVKVALEGKRLRLRVLDAGLAFDFLWQANRFVAGRPQAQADLTISAALHDFVLLARRQEDPDTLFFNRRLSIEGDTELGLLFKNTLDALDLSAFELGKLAPRSLFGRLRAVPPATGDLGRF